tara:strand:+ start:273 stop:479 length:207 start_codon:yes stop_codon:yes gene_type:complete
MIKTKDIKANQLWPYMMLQGREYRGRIYQVTDGGANNVRVTFCDPFEGYTFDGDSIVTIIDDFKGESL